jgi:hypothetical protein
MEVLACVNPLKQVRYVASYVAENKSSFEEIQNRWNVSIVPQYMDLTKGIWNVSLDSYVYKSKTQIDTVFEISTNLSFCYESVQGTNLNKSALTRLGSIHSFSPGNVANFGPFEKKWFLVEPADSQFELVISQNKLSIMRTPRLEVEFDLTFLFQRIK